MFFDILLENGPLQKSIVEEVENRKIKNVVFYGWVNNPLDFISKADMLILPSKIEGLPAVFLEAMYVKTPIIARIMLEEFLKYFDIIELGF